MLVPSMIGGMLFVEEERLGMLALSSTSDIPCVGLQTASTYLATWQPWVSKLLTDEMEKPIQDLQVGHGSSTCIAPARLNLNQV